MFAKFAYFIETGETFFTGTVVLISFIIFYGEHITLVHRPGTQCTTCVSPQINDLADPDNEVVEMALALQAVIDLERIGQAN